MKNITLKKISLINFKGLRNEEIEFGQNTDIFGANGTGKTTIFDAFTWLLFGKDSTDRKDFEIKTLDSNNAVIPKIDHEVSAVVWADDEEITIKRVLREKWAKQRGALEAEFTGNETLYYWNEVPMQQKEFQAKVGSILDETIFKLITSPLAFNSLKWQDRRSVLVQIAGDISDSELAKGNSEYEKLIAKLGNNKTLEDYRKQVLASIKKAKEDLKAIPTRIDEASRSKPEAFDFLNLKEDLRNKMNALSKLDEQISDLNKAFDSKLESQKAIKIAANNLRAELESIEQKTRREAESKSKPDTTVLDFLDSELKENKANLDSASNGLTTLKSKANTIENELKRVDAEIVNKRNNWADENAKELNFDENAFHCPTCKREFEASDVEAKKAEMEANFKAGKQAKLATISAQGKSLSEEKINLEKELSDLKIRIENGNTHIAKLQGEAETLKADLEKESAKVTPIDDLQKDLIYESILSMSVDYNAKKAQLEKITANIEDIPAVDNSKLVESRKAVVSEIDAIKAKLQNETQIDLVNQRIETLQKEESTLAQQILDVDKIQYTIESFNKLKMDTIEGKINSKFRFVKFKLFETQINGAEVECCDALINGVPFSDANNASKINAGLDIINTLCEFYQVTAPIFIDNRESVIELIDTQSQIINLIVSAEDKKLRVVATNYELSELIN